MKTKCLRKDCDVMIEQSEVKKKTRKYCCQLCGDIDRGKIKQDNFNTPRKYKVLTMSNGIEILNNVFGLEIKGV
jgi:hypothetical protein